MNPLRSEVCSTLERAFTVGWSNNKVEGRLELNLMPRLAPNSLAERESKPTAINGASSSTLVPSVSETTVISLFTRAPPALEGERFDHMSKSHVLHMILQANGKVFLLGVICSVATEWRTGPPYAWLSLFQGHSEREYSLTKIILPAHNPSFCLRQRTRAVN